MADKPMHAISRELLIAVRQYLGKMPHDEVMAMVAELERCPTVNVSQKQELSDDPGTVPAI